MMQPETETQPEPEPETPPAGPKLAEYAGAFHVHTRYSDGGDDMGAIVRHAREAGLDFVVISDHDRLTAREEGWEGWHDGVLVVVGVEIASKGGHCVALGLQGVDKFKRFHKMQPREFLKDIARRGAHVFIAHPGGTHRGRFNIRVKSWQDWSLDAFAGLEIWSYMHDWVPNVTFGNFFDAARNPGDYITGPKDEVLRIWDRLGKGRRVAGIGALDSHSRRVPWNWLPWNVVTLFPLEHIFRTVRTHVLVEPFTQDGPADTARIIQALVNGRCFVDYLPNGDATGFSFVARGADGRTALMGGEVPAGAWAFEVSSPIPADISLLHDGEPLAEASGTELQADAADAGVYRVQAAIDGKPWVFTNPIYLR